MDTVSWTFIIVFGLAFVASVTYGVVQYLKEQKGKVNEK